MASVLGTSTGTGGQVLGASTTRLADTGNFEIARAVLAFAASAMLIMLFFVSGA